MLPAFFGTSIGWLRVSGSVLPGDASERPRVAEGGAVAPARRRPSPRRPLGPILGGLFHPLQVAPPLLDLLLGDVRLGCPSVRRPHLRGGRARHLEALGGGQVAPEEGEEDYEDEQHADQQKQRVPETRKERKRGKVD